MNKAIPAINNWPENLYFDLDMVIYDKLPNLIRKNFTLLYDYWREGVESHTPLNSSIVSWTGDVSHIWKKFKSNDEYYLKKYSTSNGLSFDLNWRNVLGNNYKNVKIIIEFD